MLQLPANGLKLGDRSAESADLHTPPARLLRAVSKHAVDVQLMLEQIRGLVFRERHTRWVQLRESGARR